jgi:LacI family transcriptional regulator
MNIREIARIANVSPSTVSKALNNRSDINSKTRKKIIEIAEKQNYTPNFFAKGLKTKGVDQISVVFMRENAALSENPFYSKILEGIELELTLHNISLILNIIKDDAQKLLPRIMREKGVDGLILVGSMGEQTLTRILELAIPLVFVDPKRDLPETCNILIDNEHGAFLATQHLILAGHRQIAFISGELDRASFQQRYKGYLKALNFYHIESDARLIRTGGLENGYWQVIDILKHDKPSALFAANDINALHGYKAVYEKGLTIPNDISIIGFDDIDMAHLANPPLTTIHVHKAELGSIAVRTLLKMIDDPLCKNSASTILPVRLIERRSVKKIDHS